MSLAALKAEHQALVAKKKELTRQVQDAKGLIGHLRKCRLARNAPAFGKKAQKAEAERKARKAEKRAEKKQKKKEKAKAAKAEKAASAEAAKAAKAKAAEAKAAEEVSNGTVLYSSSKTASPFQSALFPNKISPSSPSPRADSSTAVFHTSENTPNHTPKHNDKNWWGQTQRDYDAGFDLEDLEAELECNDKAVVNVAVEEVPQTVEVEDKETSKPKTQSMLDANSPEFTPRAAVDTDIPSLDVGGGHYESPYASPALNPMMPVLIQPQPRESLTPEEIQQVDVLVDQGDLAAAANKRAEAIDLYTSALYMCHDPWIFFKRGVVNRAEGNYLSRSKYPALKQKGSSLLRKSAQDFNLVMKELPAGAPEYQAALLYRAEAFFKKGLIDVALNDINLYSTLSDMKSNNLCPDVDPAALKKNIDNGRAIAILQRTF